ncbi:hypothetical protein HDU79_008657 [Rhizoclosmatium sp. JEL0117]|nr:hypothetical protein HDU79_008657 [Rhizoclosmatium sp. JEL0117]
MFDASSLPSTSEASDSAPPGPVAIVCFVFIGTAVLGVIAGFCIRYRNQKRNECLEAGVPPPEYKDDEALPPYLPSS